MVTSILYAAELVCRMDAGRADSDNRINELKEDSPWIPFGCIPLMRQMPRCAWAVSPTISWPGFLRRSYRAVKWNGRLRAVRDFVFLVGADLIPPGRRLQIRFAVPRDERGEFLARLRTLSAGLPIEAHLEWGLTDEEPPSDASQPAPSWAHPSGIPVAQPQPLRFSTAESGLNCQICQPTPYRNRIFLVRRFGHGGTHIWPTSEGE